MEFFQFMICNMYVQRSGHRPEPHRKKLVKVVFTFVVDRIGSIGNRKIKAEKVERKHLISLDM